MREKLKMKEKTGKGNDIFAHRLHFLVSILFQTQWQQNSLIGFRHCHDLYSFYFIILLYPFSSTFHLLRYISTSTSSVKDFLWHWIQPTKTQHSERGAQTKRNFIDDSFTLMMSCSLGCLLKDKPFINRMTTVLSCDRFSIMFIDCKDEIFNIFNRLLFKVSYLSYSQTLTYIIKTDIVQKLIE